MVTNPDSLDAFLQSLGERLGVDVGESVMQKPRELVVEIDGNIGSNEGQIFLYYKADRPKVSWPITFLQPAPPFISERRQVTVHGRTLDYVFEECKDMIGRQGLKFSTNYQTAEVEGQMDLVARTIALEGEASAAFKKQLPQFMAYFAYKYPAPGKVRVMLTIHNGDPVAYCLLTGKVEDSEIMGECLEAWTFGVNDNKPSDTADCELSAGNLAGMLALAGIKMHENPLELKVNNPNLAALKLVRQADDPDGKRLAHMARNIVQDVYTLSKGSHITSPMEFVSEGGMISGRYDADE